MKAIRLDRFLSDMNVASRSELRQMTKRGQVQVNGIPAKKPEQKVQPDTDVVTVDGQRILYAETQYFLLYKPGGVVTATEDRHQRTVMEFLPEIRRTDLSPVGRLDKDTEGLLLITNDGALSHRLLSPKHHVPKTYAAEIAGCVTEQDRLAFLAGVEIGEERPTLPAELKILEAGEKSRIELTITEGRFHQVKRMFETVGKQVLTLKRLSMGSLKLDPALKPGQCRPLTEEELIAIKNS